MKHRFGILSLLLITLLFLGRISYAAEETDITANMVMQAAVDVTLYESADDTSGVVADFEAGTPLIIQEDVKDGWCKVSYKDTYGYIKAENLTMLADNDEISAEFSKVENQMQLVFDNIVLMEQEKKRSRIWGAIIVVLVVAIFGVGILSSIKGNKDKNMDNKTTEGE